MSKGKYFYKGKDIADLLRPNSVGNPPLDPPPQFVGMPTSNKNFSNNAHVSLPIGYMIQRSSFKENILTKQEYASTVLSSIAPSVYNRNINSIVVPYDPNKTLSKIHVGFIVSSMIQNPPEDIPYNYPMNPYNVVHLEYSDNSFDKFFIIFGNTGQVIQTYGNIKEISNIRYVTVKTGLNPASFIKVAMENIFPESLKNSLTVSDLEEINMDYDDPDYIDSGKINVGLTINLTNFQNPQVVKIPLLYRNFGNMNKELNWKANPFFGFYEYPSSFLNLYLTAKDNSANSKSFFSIENDKFISEGTGEEIVPGLSLKDVYEYKYVSNLILPTISLITPNQLNLVGSDLDQVYKNNFTLWDPPSDSILSTYSRRPYYEQSANLSRQFFDDTGKPLIKLPVGTIIENGILPLKQDTFSKVLALTEDYLVGYIVVAYTKEDKTKYKQATMYRSAFIGNRFSEDIENDINTVYHYFTDIGDEHRAVNLTYDANTFKAPHPETIPFKHSQPLFTENIDDEVLKEMLYNKLFSSGPFSMGAFSDNVVEVIKINVTDPSFSKLWNPILISKKDYLTFSILSSAVANTWLPEKTKIEENVIFQISIKEPTSDYLKEDVPGKPDSWWVYLPTYVNDYSYSLGLYIWFNRRTPLTGMNTFRGQYLTVIPIKFVSSSIFYWPVGSSSNNPYENIEKDSHSRLRFSIGPGERKKIKIRVNNTENSISEFFVEFIGLSS